MVSGISPAGGSAIGFSPLQQTLELTRLPFTPEVDATERITQEVRQASLAQLGPGGPTGIVLETVFTGRPRDVRATEGFFFPLQFDEETGEILFTESISLQLTADGSLLDALTGREPLRLDTSGGTLGELPPAPVPQPDPEPISVGGLFPTNFPAEGQVQLRIPYALGDGTELTMVVERREGGEFIVTLFESNTSRVLDQYTLFFDDGGSLQSTVPGEPEDVPAVPAGEGPTPFEPADTASPGAEEPSPRDANRPVLEFEDVRLGEEFDLEFSREEVPEAPPLPALDDSGQVVVEFGTEETVALGPLAVAEFGDFGDLRPLSNGLFATEDGADPRFTTTGEDETQRTGELVQADAERNRRILEDLLRDDLFSEQRLIDQRGGSLGFVFDILA